MAEIRNGLVVVRSGDEEALLLLAASGDAPSYDNLGACTSTTYTAAGEGLGASSGGFIRRGSGGAGFDPDQAPGEGHHFLDSCALCKRPLGTNNDIFMYRGNVPFCSEECRQDQIDTDEMKGRKWSNLAAKAMLSASIRKKKEAVTPVRATGTVVAG